MQTSCMLILNLLHASALVSSAGLDQAIGAAGKMYPYRLVHHTLSYQLLPVAACESHPHTLTLQNVPGKHFNTSYK
jgi:hypothetical protein